MNKEKYIIVLLTLVILGMSTIILNSNLMVSTGTIEHVGYTGMVCPKVTRSNGIVEDLGCYKNYLTVNGTNITTRQLFANPAGISTTDYVDTIMLGNTTGNFEQPTHPGKIGDCGLAQVQGMTWNMVSGDSGNVTNSTTWTSTCGGVVVNTTGLATNSGTYFAGNNFSSSVTLQSSDQLTVTWYVWIT